MKTVSRRTLQEDSEGRMVKGLCSPELFTGGNAVTAYHSLPASTSSPLFLTCPNTSSTPLWKVLESPQGHWAG